MFYSQSLISRTGPLGTIWLAAYCQKKLRKDQIAKTNIVFFVDKIIPDVDISYRIVAQLLLGIVRIFSKKVDFLHHECNEALLRIQKTFISIERQSSERAMSVPCYKESTGKPLHGRSKAHVVADNITKKTPKPSSPEKSMTASYHDVSLIIPENFQLDTFDLEIEDQSDDANINQRLTLEGEECNWQYTSKEHRYQEAGVSYDMACFTPVEDVALEEIFDVNFENMELNNTCTLELRREDDLALSGRSKTHLRARRALVNAQSNEEDEAQHNADMIEAQRSALHDSGASSKAGLDKLGSPHKTEDASTLRVAADISHDHVDMMEVQQSEHPDAEAILVQGPERPLTPDRTRDELQDRAVMLDVQQSEHPEVGASNLERQEKPGTPDMAQDNSNFQLVAASPEFTVKTPAKKERQKYPRKRKCAFDEDIVLSNAALRRGIHDARNLVLKRRKAPHTVLDFWKAEKFSNIQKAFTEPLLPYKMLEFKDLKLKKTRYSRRFTESTHQEQPERLEAFVENQWLDV